MSRWRLLVAVYLAALSGGCRTPPPNVVLIIIDTARADHWSCYGYPRLTTPHLDAFATEAIRFAQAYSVSSWTLPAHASLFTGLYPTAHHATQEHLQLDDGFQTLAELLHARGYGTAAFSGNPWVSRSTHLDRGFDVMEEMWGRPEAREDGAVPHATNRLIVDWLQRRAPQRPFFLFVNYIEPHFPYEAPALYEARFLPPDVDPATRTQATIRWVDWYLHPQPFTPRVAAVRSALYDAELAYADAIVGELFAALKQAGVYDRSLIVVASDHGENLGDHGHLDHVFSLYNSTLHVPLLIRTPGAKAGGVVRDDPVQLTDVFATIAAAAGVSAGHSSVAGADLLASTMPPDRIVLAEYDYPAQALDVFRADQRASPALDRFRRRLRSIQIGTNKLIWGSDGQSELYALATDPGERRNVFSTTRPAAEHLLAALERRISQIQQAAPTLLPLPSPSLDQATEERLRALGYLH